MLTSARKKLAASLRPFIRDFAAEIVHRTHLADPARWAQHKLTIATFHRVLPAAELAMYPMPGLVVTPEELDWLLDLFTKHYTAGTLGEMATRFALGDRPEKPLLAITFDDGQRDNHRHAYDVLASHGVHASFFVVADATERDTTLWHDRVGYALQTPAAGSHSRARAAASATSLLGSVGVDIADHNVVHSCVSRLKRMTPEQRDVFIDELELLTGGAQRPAWDGMMSWRELKELHQEGHEIGSHSQSHAILPLVSDAQLEREVAGSRAHLKRQLGFEIDTFCYPNGDCDARVAAAVERAGYRHAVTTRYGINDSDTSHYLWKRCDMQGQHARSARGKFSEGRMLLRLSGWLPSMA